MYKLNLYRFADNVIETNIVTKVKVEEAEQSAKKLEKYGNVVFVLKDKLDSFGNEMVDASNKYNKFVNALNSNKIQPDKVFNSKALSASSLSKTLDNIMGTKFRKNSKNPLYAYQQTIQKIKDDLGNTLTNKAGWLRDYDVTKTVGSLAGTTGNMSAIQEARNLIQVAESRERVAAAAKKEKMSVDELTNALEREKAVRQTGITMPYSTEFMKNPFGTPTIYSKPVGGTAVDNIAKRVGDTSYVGGLAGVIPTMSKNLEGFKSKIQDTNNETVKLKVTCGDTAHEVEVMKNNAEQVDKKSWFQNLIDGLKKTTEEGKNTTSMTDRLKDAFQSLALVKLVYLYRSVRRVTSGLVSMVENAANFEESMNLYAMSFGEYAEKANAWMENITTKLKLDPSDVMQYAGAFNNLVKGMGVTSDAAYVMSTNLTQLTYDMASYLNISNEAAQAKIQSAMAGQSRAVASVGVAMQVASLQELAYSLNIKKKVSEMTQAEKTYLRYIQLMKNTTQMQGDLGKTIMTPANAIRVLKQQLNLLSRAIGQVLTPIIMNVIPYIMAFTNVLRRAAKAVADFFGYEYTDVGNDAYAVTFEDISDGLDGVGDEAQKAGKKIKNSLAPFDELNQVMSESSGTGKGGSGIGTGSIISDLDKYVKGYDMLSKYTGDLTKKAEGLEGTVKSILSVVGTLFGAKLLGDAAMKLWGVKKALDALALKGILGYLASIAGSVGLIIGGLTVIHNTEGKINKDLGELYALQQKYGKNDSMFGWLPGAAKGANDFINRTRTILNFTGPLGRLTSNILGFFDHTKEFEEGEAKAIETRIGYLKNALDLGKTIGQTGGGLDVQYSYNTIFGNLTASIDEWTRMLTEGYEPLKRYKDELAEYNTTIGNLYTSFEESNRQFELYGYKLQATGELTKEETQAVKGHIDTMFKEANSMIDTNTNRMLSIWGDAMKSTGDLTDKEQSNILKTITDYGTSQKKELQETQNNITKTYDKAIKDRGYLTDAEYKFIEEQLQKIRDLTQKQMSQTEGDIDYTIRRINAGEKLSVEGVKNFYTSLDQYTSEQKDFISQQYAEMINAANLATEEGLKKEGKAHDEALAKREQMYAEAEATRKKALDELSTKTQGYTNSVIGSIANVYNEAKKKDDEYSKAFVKWIEEKLGPDVISSFSKVGKSGIGELFGEGLSANTFNTWVQALQGKINTATKKNPLTMNGAINWSVGTNTKTGEKTATIKVLGKEVKLDLSGKASGGPLENGDYFHMNERGNAEFLGSIGGQKAVVNQSQMVQSLAMVITGAMANMGFNGNQSGTVVVNIGNKKVYEGQGEYQNRENDRYGTTVVRV